jgi:hypothetical protein
MADGLVFRRRLLKGAAALPFAALGGCVVAPYGPYYRPTAEHPGATFKGAWCNGVAGPKSVIELPLAPGMLLSARAQREYSERDRAELPLRLTLSVPPTAPVRFAGSELRVVEKDGRRTIGSAATMRAFRYAALEPDGWIDPVRARPSGAAGTPFNEKEPFGKAIVRVSLPPGFTPDRIVVDGLAVLRDDGRLDMPAIEMSRPASKGSARDYRSAALDASLRERAAACRRDTPKLACDNIVEHSNLSFSVDQPSAHWSGRWYLFEGRTESQIEGEVAFALRAGGRWRLESNALAVRDAVAGARRAVAFRQVQLVFNDRLALETPLFAGPVAGSGEARLSIEVLLPASPPDFDVLLPALLVGSQRIEIPPIRFERRVLDGGIEPFNC